MTGALFSELKYVFLLAVLKSRRAVRSVGPYPRVWPNDYGPRVWPNDYGPRVWPHDYGPRVWPNDSEGPIFGSGVVSDGGGIRRAYTGVCPYGGHAPDSCHVHAIRRGWYSTGWYSAGIHGGMPLRWVRARFMSCSCNPTGGGIRQGGIRRAYTGVCPYGGHTPNSILKSMLSCRAHLPRSLVTGALFFKLKKEKIRLSVPRALRAWHRSACRRMR